MAEQCPVCSKAIHPVSETARLNVERYDEYRIVRIKPCQHLVVIRPLRSYVLQPYYGDQTRDDWGD